MRQRGLSGVTKIHLRDAAPQNLASQHCLRSDASTHADISAAFQEQGAITPQRGLLQNEARYVCCNVLQYELTTPQVSSNTDERLHVGASNPFHIMLVIPEMVLRFYSSEASGEEV